MLVRAADREQTAAEQDDRGDDEHHAEGLQRAAADALAVTAPVVLRVVAEQTRAEPVVGGHEEVDELVCRAEAVLRGRARDHFARCGEVKFHDRALHHDDADRKDGKLQAERHALLDMRRDRGQRYAPVRTLGAERRVFAQRVDRAADEAEQLRRDGGNRRTGGTHAERHEEEQIQPHIEKRGDREEEQRRERVAEGTQNAADQVVADLCDRADENDEAIGACCCVNLAVRGGDVDEREHLRQEQDGQHGQKRGDDERQLDLCRKRAAHAARIAAADAVGGDDAEPCRAAEGKLQENESQRECVVDARHLFGSEHLPADDGVGQGVDLLQIIGEDDRRSVEQDDAPGRARSQLDRARERAECRTESARFCFGLLQVKNLLRKSGLLF